MDVKWLGHSCFIITNEAGVRIMTDPPDEATGYKITPAEVDVVTSSHDHHDHANLALALGEPVKITEPGEYRVNDVKIKGVLTYHDDAMGKKRGRNIVFIFETDGIRLVHAGDIGAMPSPEALEAIGRADVLLVPIGGVYTVDAVGAREFANALHPKVVIPMHYKTRALSFELDDIKPFINSVTNCAIHRLRQSDCVLTRESLGSDRVITLEYDKPAVFEG